MKAVRKLTLITLIVTCSIISVFRITHIRENEISWDVLGYYMYLPATFIHHDPLLKDIGWLKQVNAEKNLAGTLYMVSENDKGEPMYFFLMGMAMFYLPFFFAANLFASATGFPVDGFSMPYQYFLAIGGIIYTIIGLIFLRKILTRYFSEKLSSLLMIIVVFGTNYIHHLTLDNLATVNVLFMLTTITVWNTIKWHEQFKRKHLLAIGISVTLATLVKPSEVFIFLLPLLWNVTSIKTLKEKAALLYSHKTWLLITFVICLAMATPQLAYWHFKTGKFFYDSYKNPGVGLDLFSPHIANVLFSYRKGWFLYTPIMMFSIIGFYFLYKNNKQLFYAGAVYFLVSFYIVASWTEWWYGAAFSMRPLITTYPILAVSLGYFIRYIHQRNRFLKIAIGTIIVFFIFLNQFQWWQFRHYIIDPYRTTKEYYWATFLKTKVTKPEQKFLMIYRDFSGDMEFAHPDKYQKSWLFAEDFDKNGIKGNMTENNNSFYHIAKNQDFFAIYETPYSNLTTKDHVWIKTTIDMRFENDSNNTKPCMVLSMVRKEGSYGYYEKKLTDSLPHQWKRIEFMYLTPEIRNDKDVFKCYIWNRGKSAFDIDNVKLEIYTIN